MADLHDLTNARFRGTFQRDPECVAEELKAIEGDQKALAEYEKEFGSANQGYTFELDILAHIVEKGLFRGMCRDILDGARNQRVPSGIVGLIREDQIKFEKFYATPQTNISRMKPGEMDYTGTFRMIEYIGRINQRPDKTITSGGEYHMIGRDPKMMGKWKMESVELDHPF